MTVKFEARAKPEWRFNVLMAFSGHEYVKTEWRPVPEFANEEAKTHEWLEVRPIAGEKAVKAEAKVSAAKPEPAILETKPLGRGRGRKPQEPVEESKADETPPSE